MSGRVWAMAGDIAKWIRRWLQQKVVACVGGSGERSRGSIGALMQSDVKEANPHDYRDSCAEPPSIPCFLDQFVPERTEVML